MKKLLLGTAIALLYAGSASATTITLDPFCDVFVLSKVDGKKVYGANSINGGCDDGLGAGAVAKVSGSPFLELGHNFFFSGSSEIWKLKLSYPLVTGGSWDLSVSTDGKNFSEINSGTYTVTGAAIHHRNKNLPSATGR